MTLITGIRALDGPQPTRWLISGGTGSLGRALIRNLLREPHSIVARVASVARDEVRAAELSASTPDPRLRVFLGDVRDPERLREVMAGGVDVVAHCAALKRVTEGIYSPGELVKTNVQGTINVIHAAWHAKVSMVVVVSSDKQCHPLNLYGLSKAVAEAYAVQANSYTVPSGTRVVVVRYGNVLSSRGSVLQTWARQRVAGEPLTVTDPTMTRFWLTLDQAVRLVRHVASVDAIGGEVFVPRLRAASLEALAHAFAPGHQIKMIGVRPGGEKRHEQLLTDDEMPRTYDDVGGYVVTPAAFSWTTGDAWRAALLASAVPADFRYESGSALRFSDDELAALIAEASGAPG